jgi:hypothetical protein
MWLEAVKLYSGYRVEININVYTDMKSCIDVITISLGNDKPLKIKTYFLITCTWIS